MCANPPDRAQPKAERRRPQHPGRLGRRRIVTGAAPASRLTDKEGEVLHLGHLIGPPPIEAPHFIPSAHQISPPKRPQVHDCPHQSPHPSDLTPPSSSKFFSNWAICCGDNMRFLSELPPQILRTYSAVRITGSSGYSGPQTQAHAAFVICKILPVEASLHRHPRDYALLRPRKNMLPVQRTRAE